jgi:putative addiction module component (TIGR02574 family)
VNISDMNATAQEILATALRLPEKDRADLAASLIESLDEAFDRSARAAWAEEISRRLAALDSGSVKAAPWDEARRAIAGGVV